MIVEETKIDGWNNKIPKFTKCIYPQPLDNNLPLHYNVSIYCGARGSGKTVLAVKYLHELEKRGIENNIPMRIILISPTAKSDSNKIFDVLKSLSDDDILEEYSDSALQQKISELRNDLDDGIDYKKYKIVYKKFIKIEENINLLTPEELTILSKFDFKDPKDIPKPKYPNGFITFLIVDDCACTSIFKNGKSYFNNVVIKNRHNSEYNIPMNIIICVQQLFNIPKTIRLNANVICLFRYGNKKVVLDDLYALVSAWTTPEEFEKLYDKATEPDYGCLVIDLTKGKPIFKRGWDTNLTLSKNTEEPHN